VVDATVIFLFLGDVFATLRMLRLNFRSFEEVGLYIEPSGRDACAI
jgi:hypothetical protein